ncbi:MAG: hypothetical protein ACR2MM_03325 [Flavobacteriaceae bacterium]
MKKIVLLSIGMTLIFNVLTAQNKRELQAEVTRLNSELAQKDQALNEARTNERISVVKADEYEAQVAELQAANATLLENIKIFTESSQQRSETIGQTLESLRDKEAKLKVISDEFGKYDSLGLLVITGFKQTLGEEARIGAGDGAVMVELSKTMLFGNAASNAKISEDGKAFLMKIADVIKLYPDVEATVVAQLDSAGNKELSQKRSSAIIASITTGASASETDRISASFKQSMAESYQIRIHPGLSQFYLKIRQTLKNSR